MERLNKSNLSTINKAYTHGGVFHADDVFSSALLELMNPNIEIVRTFSVPEDAELAFDIGGGLYDHHQEESGVRINGVPYAAFGLLWRDLGAEFLGSEEEANLFDQIFVQPLDITDNIGGPNSLSSAIGSFNPTWENNDPEESNKQFRKAVEFAAQILLNNKIRVEGKLKARTLVEAALDSSENRIVVLPRFAPWQDVLIPSEEANFVIYPSQRGGYNLQVVPVDFGTQAAKKPLPKDWLKAAPNGCTFVHTGLFIATFDTVDNAIKAAMAVPKWEQYDFNFAQMNEMRLGLEHGIDVSLYAKPEFDWT